MKILYAIKYKIIFSDSNVEQALVISLRTHICFVILLLIYNNKSLSGWNGKKIIGVL